MMISKEFRAKKKIFLFYSIDKEKICMYSFGTYQFDRLASVAQSAERNHGKVEVSGSIPLGGFLSSAVQPVFLS